MSAFVSKGGKTPKVYVYDRHGRKHRRTLGTAEYPELASAVEARVQAWRTERRWDVLDAIVARLLTCCEAYRYEMAGTLAKVIAERTAAQAKRDAEDADIDLSPLVESLVKDAKYRTQIRRFIPKGERFPASHFTRKRIAEFLSGLTRINRGKDSGQPASISTRQRYKAALSAFAAKLIEREVLETNPVERVKLERQVKDRDPVYLDERDTWAVLDRLSGPQRALEALMAGSGMEWGACAVLTRADVDPDARVVRARGTKNRYRDRYVEVVDDRLWAIVRDYVRSVAPGVRLFPMTSSAALDAHQKACKDANVRVTTIHQHRHGFAVRAIQAKRDPQWIKRQLGHSPRSSLLWTTYGVYLDRVGLGRTGTEADTRSDTNQDTSPRNDLKSEAKKGA